MSFFHKKPSALWAAFDTGSLLLNLAFWIREGRWISMAAMIISGLLLTVELVRMHNANKRSNSSDSDEDVDDDDDGDLRKVWT